MSVKNIRTLDDIRSGLNALKKIDPRLRNIAKLSGEIPLRLRNGGFDSLCQIVVSQQLSVASADAIWSRLTKLICPFNMDTFEQFTDDQIAEAGLSNPKIKTVRAIVNAQKNGLNLEKIAELPAEKAHNTLCQIWGIGRWSADIYLLFCAGHPDIFPSGDVALQHAVRHAFNLPYKPSPEELDEISEIWTPWRGVAARLFWSYYRTIKNNKETMPM